jgi:acetyltransferase-like isoleucine patch superfamily enzyme
MTGEENARQSRTSRFLARVKRSWARDKELSLARRIEKGLRFVTQLLRARAALKDCDRVGAHARVAGRMRISNRGSIVIGDYLNINSTWVPTELLTGPGGRIEIGDEVLINFGTVIAAACSVTIGARSHMGPHCIVSDVEIPETADITDSAAAKPIVIGQDVWLAGRVTLRPGVKIGDGAVIVAGSIVESDVPAHVMASGIPARLLPKLGAAPRRPSAGPAAPTSPARPVETADVQSTSPRLCGHLLSDFNLEELANELRLPGVSPALDSVIAPPDGFREALETIPPPAARDFGVVWTTPMAAAPSFARLLAGERVEETGLMREVEAFCISVQRFAAHHARVFVPTWTLPWFVRGAGVLDGRPGGAFASLIAMNQHLMQSLALTTNVWVLNAARWQSAVGPAASNPRAWYLAHMAASRALVAEAAQEIRDALGIRRTVLVLALEAALWGGVGADAAVLSPPVNAAYADFRSVLRLLTQRGTTVALVGNAEESVVNDALKSSAVQLLGELNIGCSCFGPAPVENIRAVATRLSVAQNAIIYIDAQAQARAQVRAALPQVYVPDWPVDRLLYPSKLLSLRATDPTLESDRAPVAHT